MNLTERIDNIAVIEDSLAFWSLGQVGVAIKGGGGVLYVDPYLTESDGQGGGLPRAFPPPISPDAVSNASAALLTHDHIDHTDPDTILPIAGASPEARFVCPFTSRETLVAAGLDGRRITVPEAGSSFEVAGATITALPSAHTGLEHDAEKRERGYPYLGYVIEWNGVTLYHAGDTVVYDGLIEALAGWEIDVAFLPINGRDYFRTSNGIVGNLDFREAAELAKALDIKLTVPTHYDLLAANSVDPGYFVSYLRRIDPYLRHKLLVPGELLYFVREKR